MKLELKHLASYLSHGLNIKDVKHGSVFEALHFITTPHQDFSLFKGNLDQLINDKYLKPILFPLSSLTKEITINGETFNPIKKIQYLRRREWTYFENENEWYEHFNHIDHSGNAYYSIKDFPFLIIQKLFEWKVDVFGLIDAELAEPVTEDFNPYK